MLLVETKPLESHLSSMEGELIEPHAHAPAPAEHTDVEPSTDGDEKAIQKLDAGGAPVDGSADADADGDLELEPYQGMEFESEEAAKVFYGAYAQRVGFRVRISRYTRSRRDNSIISRRIVCSKEGFREDRHAQSQGLFAERRRQQQQQQRAVTRVGCKAMIMVKKIDSGKWIVTKFVKEHNHGPVPPRKVEVRLLHKDDDSADKSLVSDGDAIHEPFEGMEFDTEEAAKLFYSAYARHMGFRARISKYCRSRRDNSIISRQIVCSKEGFREVRVKKEESDEGRIKRPRVITRIGCKAMIIVKKLGSGKWIVSKFVKEHNHALVISKNVPFLQLHTRKEKSSIPLSQNGNAGPNGAVVGGGCCTETQGASQESLTVLYNQLCYEAIRYAQEGATTVETYNVAMTALREAVEKVAAAKRGALAVAHPAFLVGATNQGVTAVHGSNSFLVPAKALQELQCSNDVKQALRGQELVLLQQPISFVLIPSASPNDSSSVNRSVDAPLILDVANGQIVRTSDSTKMACSSQGMNTANQIQLLSAPPSVEGLVANGLVSPDLPTGKKRELQTTDGDAEQDAAHKYQKLDAVGVGQANSTPRSGSNLSNPGLSDAQMVAIPALPVTLYMPVMGSLPESYSGTPGGTYAVLGSPIEAQPVSAHPAENDTQSHAAIKQLSVTSHSAALTPAPPFDQVKSYTGPNPQVHATALAAGARIVPPKAAASLIKAIEARVRSVRALAQSSSPGGCKRLSAEAWSPRHWDSDQVQREQSCQMREGSQAPVESSEEPRYQEQSETQEELEGHSVVVNPGERQLELVEAAGGC